MSNIAEQFKGAHDDLKRTIFRAIGSRSAYTRNDISEHSGIHRNTLARWLHGGEASLSTLITLASTVDYLEYSTNVDRHISEAKTKRRTQ